MYSDDGFFGTPSYRTSVFGAEAATGVQVVRQPFDWRRIETAVDDYDFRDYDDFVIRAAVAGMRVLPVLGDPPSFRAVAATRENSWSPPKSNAEFAAFAAKLVERYGPKGTIWATHPDVPALPIRSWQIWNEPNLLTFWNTGPSAAAYTALLEAASGAIHAADPGAEVVAAGLPASRAGTPLATFLGEMLEAGAAAAFDTAAIHAYAADAADSVALVELTRSILAAHGAATPIWVTEVGWATSGPLSPYTVDEAQQAVNVRDVISTLADRRGVLGVRGIVVFRWRDALSTFDAWPLHAGLVRADGTAKPGLGAFSDAVAALSSVAVPSPQFFGMPDQAPGQESRSATGGPLSAAGAPMRVSIAGGELSRFGFLRVHMRCFGKACTGRLRAGRTRRACSGQRRFKLAGGESAVLRIHLKGKRRQLRRCRHILVTASTGAKDLPAAAFLPKKAVRYAR
jgi:hypothetical protein